MVSICIMFYRMYVCVALSLFMGYAQEVFDLQVTLTFIFYLQMTLGLVKASKHGVIAKLFIMNILRYLTLK